MSEYKPKKQIGFAVSNLMRNANGTLNAVSGDIKDRLSNPNNNKNIKLKNIMQDYNEAIEEQFAAQQGVFEMINDLKGFMTDAQIRKILQDKKIKSAGGFSNKEINNLMNGKFTVPVFNKQGLRDAAKNNPAISKYLNNIQDTFLHRSLYPNPSNGNFFIQTHLNDHLNMKIYDINGKLMYSKKSMRGLTNFNLNLSNGLYFVYLTSKSIHQTQKLIISK